MTRAKRQTSGFSLIELLTVIAILVIVMGAVFAQIITVQRRFQSEQTKLDMFQESREFMDQIGRDVHQAGYPNTKMFNTGVISLPLNNDPKNAVGLVQVTSTSITFQADVDGDGQVESVMYQLNSDPGNPGSCPCWLQRSQVVKAPLDPLAQPTNFSAEVQQVINSAGTLPLTGQVNLPGGPITYAAQFGAYTNEPVFQAFDVNGNIVPLPIDIDTSPVGIRTIKTVRITLNVLGRTPDQQTGLPSVITLTSSARIEN